jgi:hypothetical protein
MESPSGADVLAEGRIGVQWIWAYVLLLLMCRTAGQFLPLVMELSSTQVRCIGNINLGSKSLPRIGLLKGRLYKEVQVHICDECPGRTSRYYR